MKSTKKPSANKLFLHSSFILLFLPFFLVIFYHHPQSSQPPRQSPPAKANTTDSILTTAENGNADSVVDSTKADLRDTPREQLIPRIKDKENNTRPATKKELFDEWLKDRRSKYYVLQERPASETNTYC